MTSSDQKRIYGISYCNPVDVEPEYLDYVVDYALKIGVNHMQIIGPIHDSVHGNLDGMTLYRKYAQFNDGKDLPFIEKTRNAFAASLPKAHEAGVLSYVWHHELDLPDGFAEAFPETLNEYGDFEITHPVIKDFLEHKVYDFFEQYPLVDGIILTLHETKVPLLKLKSQKLPRSERAKYVTKILYDACRELGKELIVRPFASIPEDYSMLMEAYAGISTDLAVMDKWTQFDWSLCLPHNAFFKTIKKNPLLVETDIFGEFFGKGRLPLMLLDHIRDKAEYCESFPIKGYCARIDRNGMIPFGDVNEVNLAIMNAAMHGEDTEKAAIEFYRGRYPKCGDEIFALMRNTEEVVRRTIYLKGYYFSELSYFPQLNHSRNHFYFEMMKDDYKITSGEWFIPINWDRGPIEGVLEEKRSAAAEANRMLATLEGLQDKLEPADYEALLVKFRNLKIATEIWQLLVDVFYHYVRFFSDNNPAEEGKLEASLNAMLAKCEEGEKLLGAKFFCELGDYDAHKEFVRTFIADVREAFEAEKKATAEVKATSPIDFVICAGGNEGHLLKKEVNFSDTGCRNGMLYRLPGHSRGRDWSRINAHGWFSYELAIRPEGETVIEVLAGSFTDRLKMKVTVNGTEFAVDEAIADGETKLLRFPYNNTDKKETAVVRIDRVSGDTPVIHRIITR